MNIAIFKITLFIKSLLIYLILIFFAFMYIWYRMSIPNNSELLSFLRPVEALLKVFLPSPEDMDNGKFIPMPLMQCFVWWITFMLFSIFLNILHKDFFRKLTYKKEKNQEEKEAISFRNRNHDSLIMTGLWFVSFIVSLELFLGVFYK